MEKRKINYKIVCDTNVFINYCRFTIIYIQCKRLWFYKWIETLLSTKFEQNKTKKVITAKIKPRHISDRSSFNCQPKCGNQTLYTNETCGSNLT